MRATLLDLSVTTDVRDLARVASEILRTADPHQAARRIAWLREQMLPRFTTQYLQVVLRSLYRGRQSGGNVGLNAGNGVWGDLFEAGVIDAAKVTRTALQNAASVTSLLLTSRTVIVELKENKKKVAGAVK